MSVTYPDPEQPAGPQRHRGPDGRRGDVHAAAAAVRRAAALAQAAQPRVPAAADGERRRKPSGRDGDPAGGVGPVPLRDAERHADAAAAERVGGAAAADDRLLEGRAAAGKEERLTVSCIRNIQLESPGPSRFFFL